MNAATQYALNQIGKAYRFGAPETCTVNPPSLDCSGLVRCALHQINVTVEHSSGLQAQHFKDKGRLVANTRANRKKLHPADVVFYYGSRADTKSISHCALFIKRTVTWRYLVVAAVDENYGVIQHRMYRFVRPIGFGFVGHD